MINKHRNQFSGVFFGGILYCLFYNGQDCQRQSNQQINTANKLTNVCFTSTSNIFNLPAVQAGCPWQSCSMKQQFPVFFYKYIEHSCSVNVCKYIEHFYSMNTSKTDRIAIGSLPDFSLPSVVEMVGNYCRQVRNVHFTLLAQPTDKNVR